MAQSRIIANRSSAHYLNGPKKRYPITVSPSSKNGLSDFPKFTQVAQATPNSSIFHASETKPSIPLSSVN